MGAANAVLRRGAGSAHRDHAPDSGRMSGAIVTATLTGPVNWLTADESRSSVGARGSVACWWQVAQRGVAAVVVVVVFPVADHYAGLSQ
jgi:hypothetical protein